MEGGGAGAGGFCANATGTRSPIASASSTKVRVRGFTDLLLGRERQSHKFSAQVSSSQGFRRLAIPQFKWPMLENQANGAR
jgi:hypothetical protein